MPRRNLNASTVLTAARSKKVTPLKRAAATAEVGVTCWSRPKVSVETDLSIRKLERLAQEGDGPPMIMIGRRVLYPVAELNAWLRARMVNSTSEASVRQSTEASS